jgi:hypothetical protein
LPLPQRRDPRVQVHVRRCSSNVRVAASSAPSCCILRLPPGLLSAAGHPARAGRFTASGPAIRALAEQHADKEIAVRLNAEGLASSTGKAFTASMISWIRFKHRIPGPSRLPGTLTVNEAPARYGVSMHVVYYWIARGIVAATQRETNTPYAITMNDNVDRRLRKWVANSGHLHRHPKRELYEVYYARCVGMPSGRCLPSAFGM